MDHRKIKMMCEAAMLLAFAQILGYIRLYEFPNGGSIDAAMLPIILFSVRYGVGWGTLVGFAHGVLQYFLGRPVAIDWTSMVMDYLVAYAVLGLGAGLMKGKSNAMVKGTLLGGFLRFMAHFVVGAVVWGKWMPDTYFGMTMTNEWFYSFLYNAPYMVPCIIICLVLILLLRKPLKKYFEAEDLQLEG